MSKEQAKRFFYEATKNKKLSEEVSQLMGSAASKEEAAVSQSDFKRYYLLLFIYIGILSICSSQILPLDGPRVLGKYFSCTDI